VSPKDSIEWSRSKLIGFRFVFVFSLLAIAETYEPWSVVPYVGRFLSTVLDDVLTKIATAAAIHLFHVSGIAATSHATDSRDTALSWVTMLLIAATSAVATAIWSVVDRRRRNHVTAAVWLRYLVRIALIFIMLRYGIFKVFPLQMSRPSLGVSGTVDALGEGVTNVNIGDVVFGVPDYIGYPTSGAAEYAVLKVFLPVPEGLNITEAAALPMAVETAARSIDLLGLKTGQTLMINGVER
jgi:hypothetical protein